MVKTKAKKILVVDDDLGVVRMVTSLLKKQGYQCIGAEDGLEALVMVKKENPDLVSPLRPSRTARNSTSARKMAMSLSSRLRPTSKFSPRINLAKNAWPPRPFGAAH